MASMSKSRKKAVGAYKPEMWALPAEAAAELYQALEDKFVFFFEKLNVVNTRELIDSLVTVVDYHQPKPASAKEIGDDMGLSD